MWIELTASYNDSKVIINLNRVEVITDNSKSGSKGETCLYFVGDPTNPYPVNEKYETVKNIIEGNL